MPFKDDKPKDTEISPFEAGLNWQRQAKEQDTEDSVQKDENEDNSLQ